MSHYNLYRLGGTNGNWASEDYGATWKVLYNMGIYAPVSSIFKALAYNENILAITETDEVWISNKSGNWNILGTLTAGSYFNSVIRYKNSKFYIAERSGIHDNYIQTWEIGSSQIMLPSTDTIQYSDPVNGFTLYEWRTPNIWWKVYQSFLTRSTDGGNVFDSGYSITTGTVNATNPVSGCSYGNTVIIVDNNQYLWTTTDGGVTWTRILPSDLTIPPSVSINGVWRGDTNFYLSLTDGNNATKNLISDDGLSWYFYSSQSTISGQFPPYSGIYSSNIIISAKYPEHVFGSSLSTAVPRLQKTIDTTKANQVVSSARKLNTNNKILLTNSNSQSTYFRMKFANKLLTIVSNTNSSIGTFIRKTLKTVVSNSSSAFTQRMVMRFMTAVSTSISTFFGYDTTFRQTLNAVSTSISKISINQHWVNIWSMLYKTSQWIGVKIGTAIGVTSPDGATWTTQTLPSSQNWVALANNGTINATIAKGTAIAASSPDGITWSQRSLPATRPWSALTAKTGLFVAVALESDKCAISADGITWTEQSMPISANWTSVTTNGTIFVAVSDNGIAATSLDGITWSQYAMPDQLHFNCVTWALNQFTAVASGPTNLAASSPDGVTWTRVYMPSSQNWTGVGPGVGNPNV